MKQDSAIMSALHIAARARYVVFLCSVLALTSAAYVRWTDWNYFAAAADVLTGTARRVYFDPAAYFLDDRDAGLTLYAEYPNFQFGPPPILLAALLRHVGPNEGQYAGIAVILGLGLAALWLLERAALQLRPADRTNIPVFTLLGGLVLAPAWAILAGRFVHLDDAIAVAAVSASLYYIARRQPIAAGMGAGLAAASKPWAIGFLVLAIAFSGRQRLRMSVAALVLIAIFWGPFVVADLRTLDLGSVAPPVAKNSFWVLMGFEYGSPPPGSLRYLQMLTGLAAALVVGLRGRWFAVPLVVIASRVLLDPATHAYYGAALVLAALIWDALAWRWPLPIVSLIAFLIMFNGQIFGSFETEAYARSLCCTAVIATAVAIPSRFLAPWSLAARPRAQPHPDSRELLTAT